MGKTFLQKIQELTEVNGEIRRQESYTRLIQDIKNKIESAAKIGNSYSNFCNFYDTYPQLDKEKDYIEVLDYFQQEGFDVIIHFYVETFLYKIKW